MALTNSIKAAAGTFQTTAADTSGSSRTPQQPEVSALCFTSYAPGYCTAYPVWSEMLAGRSAWEELMGSCVSGVVISDAIALKLWRSGVESPSCGSFNGHITSSCRQCTLAV